MQVLNTEWIAVIDTATLVHVAAIFPHCKSL
jgi:hypothetical protein